MKKQTKLVLNVLLVLSLIVCAVVGIFRIQVESEYKDVQVAIRYSDVLNIAKQTNVSVETILKELKSTGANALFVRENTVIPMNNGDFVNFKEQGKATVYEGYELEKIYPENTRIKRSNIYIETFDDQTHDLIYNNLAYKGISAYDVNIEGEKYIEVTVTMSILATLGVGYNYDDMKVAADLGYIILPQAKSWDHMSEESLDFFIQQIEALPNLGTIYFADSKIPGFTYPALVDLVNEKGLGFVEFFSEKQQGFGKLAKTASEAGTHFNVERLHTINDNQIKDYSVEQLMDRYMLALTERNLRTFLFKMPNTLNIDSDASFLIDSVKAFTEDAQEKGYNIAETITPYNLQPGNYLLSLAAGVGALIAFILLCDLLGFAKIGYVLGAIGIVGYAGLLKLSPSLGIRMMALFGAVIFPTYGVTIALKDEQRSLKETIFVFLKTCLISFGGALTIIGTLSRTSFGLGIDVFSGVKLAHLAPVVLIVLIVYYQRHGFDFAYYKSLLTNNVTYLAVAVIGLAAVVLLIYTSRTGNSGNISSMELTFRQLLDTYLGVRPRTKEFLIGHPIMLALLYFGYKDKYIPFLVLGIIGQISLVNTYAHIHTPIVISLIRSVYGIVFGVVIGIVLIYALKFVGKVINKWMVKNQ